MSDVPWDDDEDSSEYPAIRPTGPQGYINGSDLLGPYGVTSAELAAIDPAQIARWERERQRVARDLREQAERARTRLLDHLDELLRQGRLSGSGYDLLQDEIGAGWLPDIYRGATGRWLVYCDRERRTWTLDGWNQHAQDLTPTELRETARLYLTPPPVLPGYHPAPRLTPRLTPLVGLPEATTGARRPWHPRLDARVPRATPPPTPRVTPPLWLIDDTEAK